MNTTTLIKGLKLILRKNKTEIDLHKYAVASILENNPTYKQLHTLREIVVKEKELKLNYYFLINDMMTDIAQGRAGESLELFKQEFSLY
jgi:hypothetical protein